MKKQLSKYKNRAGDFDNQCKFILPKAKPNSNQTSTDPAFSTFQREIERNKEWEHDPTKQDEGYIDGQISKW